MVTPAKLPGGHNGGESALMRSFLQQTRTRDRTGGLTSARVSANTHLLAFAAEESWLTGKIVGFAPFVRQQAKA